MHVHVHGANGDAKFLLEPSIELAENYGLRSGEISTAHKLIEEALHKKYFNFTRYQNRER